MAVSLIGWILTLAFAGHLVVDPVAFPLGPLAVRWYGLFIALTIGIGLPWFLRRALARGIDGALAERAAWWGVVVGVVGARLLYVLQNLDVFGANPVLILAVQDGGLSIHGALLGGIVAVATVTRFQARTFWSIADAIVPPLLLGMILGRFGNFTNHELFGPPTDVAWKMFVPLQDRPVGSQEEAFYHPTFLYDAILNTVVLLILLTLERSVISAPGSPSRWRSRLLGDGGGVPGQLFLLFIAGISLTRFIVEFWRLGDTTALGLSPAQLVSLLLFASAGALLGLVRLGRSKLP
ncbi:prolipoprotein diacylglyceryl transferase [Candidatus Berkelbacteria bacterium]|nr:prolipoprotein diacylglyceryl transferase [Candidatus Berkelbacteria bacterium]